MRLPTDHIERIKERGYTEAEARFLYMVIVHSGYFTLRQFLAFSHARRGKRSIGFAQKLIKYGHARMRDYLGAGSVFHIFSRTIYGQVEKDNLRNRKAHSFDFIRTRLVLLDFILENRESDYLETEQDKVSFFYEKLGVPKDFLPAKVYEGRPGSPPTIRYFVDKFPLFLAPPFPGAAPVVTLSFVDSGFENPLSFPGHLTAYQGLFRQLKTFRFLYVAPKDAYFPRAEERFRSLVRRPLESEVWSGVLRYFQIRKRWENHEYVVPVTADLVFLNEARRRFDGARFDGLYHAWNVGELSENGLRAECAQLAPNQTVFFDTYLVRNHRSPLTVERGMGERRVKDADHRVVHLAVHPQDERKSFTV
jgi:hypothetical protein